jgi:tripartite-type tricarboxylate transporter receptor subunit TctC
VIADAKAKPSALTVATPGAGGLGYFATIEFEQLAHVKLLRVRFEGEGPELTALLGGHIEITLINTLLLDRPSVGSRSLASEFG